MGKQKKIMYVYPQTAQYLFETYNFDGTFTRWHTTVEVLGETVKSYLIKLKEPIRNHFIGDQIWVMKKKVRFPTVPPRVSLDTSHYWFNNFESRELNMEN